jgi:alpha-ribazole phosphatase/probable phosphoglycerate mutase
MREVAARLVLVRHGEPEAWARGRCCGRLDPGLSEAGAAQAERAARALAAEPIRALYASPSRRALETAAPTAARLGLAVGIDARLQEVDFGAFEGLTFDEARQRDPAAYDTWMASPGEVRFPGGESWTELRGRVLPCVAELAGRHPSQGVALFAHGGPIRAVLADALGLDAAGAFSLTVEYGAVALLERADAGWKVRLLSGTGPAS